MERALTEAFRGAGGDAIRKSRTEAKRKIRRRKRLRDSFLHSQLILNYPLAGTPLEGMSWHLKPSQQAVPLTDYPFRQLWKNAKTKDGEVRRDKNNKIIKVPAGISIQVNKGSRKILRHAFILTMKNGHTGIFQRRYKNKRLPLDKLFSSRVSDVASDDNFMPSLRESAQVEFTDTMFRLLKIKLGQL